jgi:hypothetical protein
LGFLGNRHPPSAIYWYYIKKEKGQSVSEATKLDHPIPIYTKRPLLLLRGKDETPDIKDLGSVLRDSSI